MTTASYADGTPMGSHDVMRAMTARARELGWEVDWTWQDGSGRVEDPAGYEIYLSNEEIQEPTA